VYDSVHILNEVFRNTCLSSYPQRMYLEIYTVVYATTKDVIMNECYNEKILSIKSGCCNAHRCYNERRGILFIIESLIIIFTSKRLFMLFMCVRLFMLFAREYLLKVFTKKSFYAFQIYMYSIQKLNKLIIYYFKTYIFFILYYMFPV
jgi:hypothetical protein